MKANVHGETHVKAGTALLKADRQTRILEVLQESQESMRISSLSQLLNVAPVTIRRDVQELARQGMVLSRHGGVTVLRPHVTFEPGYQVKLTEEAQVKDALARLAVGLVEEGGTIFLDGGTTVGAMVRYLVNRHVTVVSNALNVVNVLARSRSIRLILIGGAFRPESQTFLGTRAVRQLQDLRFDVAFMGAEGFDVHQGLEVPDEADAEFKTMAAKSASQVVVMASGSKCGQRRLYRFAEWKDVQVLVTTPVEGVDVIGALRNHGTRVMEASGPSASPPGA